MTILCYFKTSLVTFVQRITLKSMFSKKAYKSVARVLCVCSIFIYLYSWAYGKEKIRGAERNLPDIFGLCPRCQKNFPEKLSKIVVDGGEE